MASPPPPGGRLTPYLQTNNVSPMPDPKRQKLSHGPSPLGTSPVSSAYPPYEQQPWNQHMVHSPLMNQYPPNPLESFNQPQPVHSPSFDVTPKPGAGTMGPPEKPQKAVDPNDLTDMVALSGIDLRAEEEYLAQSYNRPSLPNSFEIQRSSTASPSNSFSQWTQNGFGSQPAFSPGAPFNQPPVNEGTLEQQLQEKHKRAARAHAYKREKELADAFLLTAKLRDVLGKKSYEEHVRFSQQGIVDPSSPRAAILRPEDARATTMTGPDGKGIVAATAKSTVEQNSPVVEVLALLSLACNERMRNIIEDALAVSRARQHGSHGVVPPEWQGIAQGEGAAQPATAASQNISQTAWDRPPDSAVSPLTVQQPKPIDPGSGRLPTPPTEPSPTPQATISYKPQIPLALQQIARQDREAEQKRLERRKQRLKSQLGSETPSAATPSATNGTTGAVTPTDPKESVITAPKMTKKAMLAEKKSAVNDEVIRKQANATANLALGGGGKRYSWLASGGGAKSGGGGGGGGLAAGAGMGRGVGKSAPQSGTATPNSASGGSGAAKGGVAAVEEPGMRSKETWRRLGQWREDGEKGAGVQIRDLVVVLERDGGAERRTLAKCLARLRSDDKER